MKELEEIPAYLPNGAALKDAVQKAKDWLQEVEALQVCEPGCWGGTVTLLLSPEPPHTPCVLQGSGVALFLSVWGIGYLSHGAATLTALIPASVSDLYSFTFATKCLQ